jgi:hypothetical protein
MFICNKLKYRMKNYKRTHLENAVPFLLWRLSFSLEARVVGVSGISVMG